MYILTIIYNCTCCTLLLHVLTISLVFLGLAPLSLSVAYVIYTHLQNVFFPPSTSSCQFLGVACSCFLLEG